ncbi:NAD(P)-binding protein [Microthyrium microscopicum]|uniref:NAD(P)-binding protein n=1 Tax=Microthyrium microscopicum TaxID=703497 RepID=A0A6A6UJ73_9PEZI|nr:NAD(P)-binding protein [Microthyrium microscopicum]
MSSDKKVVFITGANTGLGLEVVKALYKTTIPYEIIIGTRTISKGDQAADLVKKEIPNSPSTLNVIQVDVSSDDSISKAVSTIQSKFGRLDILVNNAGGNYEPESDAGRMTIREAFNTMWDVNVSGTHVLTHEAAPLLLKSSDPRLLFITSGTACITETEDHETDVGKRINASPEAGWPKPQGPNPITGYRSSKVGLNMLMTQWARTLKNDGVKVWAISPGFLATGLAGIGGEALKKMGARDPSEGGNFIRDVIEGKHDHNTAKVIRANMIQAW